MGHNDEKLNKFVDQLMTNDALEQPSKDFTNLIMRKVENMSNSSVTVYKPLISKTAWAIIIAAFAVLIGYMYFNEPTGNSRLSEIVDLSKINMNPLSDISFNFSKILMYASVLFALMIGVQIPLLKNYFNKQLSV